MPGRKPRLQLPYTQWLEADRLLWQQAFCNDDPFAEAAAGARLARASQHCYLLAWRRFLGFLAIEEPTALEIAPTERLTNERVRAFVAHLGSTNIPRSIANLVEALYQAARLMMPQRDWAWLKVMKTRLHVAAPRPAPTGAVITSLQLLNLGERMMDKCKIEPGTQISMDDAIRYRDGLMIAFVAFIPIRPKNLAALEIGRHLLRERDCWFVIIPGEEMKAGTPTEYTFPALLEPYLAVYLDFARPRIAPRSDLRRIVG
jgi:integrase/recombinase XerD